MTKYNEWKLITESLSGVTLGLSRPNVIGGSIRSQFNFHEDDFEKEEDDEEEEDFDGEDDESEDDFEGEDEAGDESFPPEDSSEMDEPSEDDEELSNDIAAIGEPAGSKDGGLGDDLGSAIGSPSGDKGVKAGGDMDFLGDIDPALLGDEGDSPVQGPPEENGEKPSTPCPDCNAEGMQEVGDEECPTCNGLGFADDMGDEGLDVSTDLGDLGAGAPEDSVDPQSKDTMDLMSMMACYMGKYMKKEAAQYEEMCKPNDDKSCKKVKKDKKKDKKKDSTHCEVNSFLNSLKSQSSGKAHKSHNNGMSEDALLAAMDVNYDREDDNRPGQVGYAPQGRVGSVGSGYQKSDFADMPILGESRKFPTLNEWISNRNKKPKSKK
jgi:hypothetical protein